MRHRRMHATRVFAASGHGVPLRRLPAWQRAFHRAAGSLEFSQTGPTLVDDGEAATPVTIRKRPTDRSLYAAPNLIKHEGCLSRYLLQEACSCNLASAAVASPPRYLCWSDARHRSRLTRAVSASGSPANSAAWPLFPALRD